MKVLSDSTALESKLFLFGIPSTRNPHIIIDEMTKR